jgi:hypothetical protein
MTIFFESIEENQIEKFFNNFTYENCVFFEIISSNIAIGFYGVKTITEKVCEISLYIYEKYRGKFTKDVTKKCLEFPFILGFNKIIIRTESEKMRRFLCKLTKYGVNYLFKHYDNYLFEVS